MGNDKLKNVWEEELLELYGNGIIDETGLDEAVTLGWISDSEKMLIIGTVSRNKLL